MLLIEGINMHICTYPYYYCEVVDQVLHTHLHLCKFVLYQSSSLDDKNVEIEDRNM